MKYSQLYTSQELDIKNHLPYKSNNFQEAHLGMVL